MITAAYKYYVDWDNDGDFGDPYEDISGYVLAASWRTGRSGAPPEYDTAGVLALTLDNSSAVFSSFNSSSPLYGLIRPNLRVRAAMKIGSGPEVTMWQGYLETIVPAVGARVDVSTAELTAYGVLAQFNEGEVELALEENITTGAALGALLDSDGFPSGERAIDAGRSTLSKWWVRQGTSLLEAMRELVDAELGRLREGKDGKIVFESRAHIFNPPHNTPQAVYGTGTLHMWNLRQEDPLAGIYNLVRGAVRTFNRSEDKTLVVISDIAGGLGTTPPIVPAKVGGNPGTLTLWIEYPTPASPADHIAVDQWTTVDYEANTQPDGQGTDITADVSVDKTAYGPRLKLDFSNQNAAAAHLVVLRARGIAVVESDPIPIKSEDAASQAKYRRREYPRPSRWLTDLEESRDYADHLVAVYKDPRPRLVFDVRANYDQNHLEEVQAREVGDRIRVVAGSAYGLYIDAEFIIDSLAHQVDAAGMHVMTVACTVAPTAQLPASGTAYTPKTIPEPTVGVPHVPDDLQVAALASGLAILFGVEARKWNEGITEAEFRAKFFAAGTNYESVDLRTPAEGGTLEHNGTTAFVVAGIVATQYGAQYQITSAAQGVWYYAWRLKNAEGWSVWSDGNDTPRYARDRAATEDPSMAADGPPADWTVAIQPAAVGHAVVVTVSRPATRGKKILAWAVQIKDATMGAWRALDAGAGAAVTKFDGTAVGFNASNDNRRFTRVSGQGLGTAAVGDLVLLDYAGGSWALDNCNWATIEAIEGNDPATATWFEIAGRFNNAVQTDLRLKIVKPPWEWNTEGYLGDQPNRGLWSKTFWAEGGDVSTQTFVSDPIAVPAGTDLSHIQARVWFDNGFSRSDGGVHSDFCPAGGGGSGSAIQLDASSGYVYTDAALGYVFTFTMTTDTMLMNPTNARDGQPIVWIVRQDAVGGHALSLDGKFRLGDQVEVVVSDMAGSRTLVGCVYSAAADQFDMVPSLKGY